MEDYLLFEKMAQFNRERIPERVVHAKGAAAYGTFTVTHDVTQFTSARLLNTIGKKTEMLARFSTVAGEKGSPIQRAIRAALHSSSTRKRGTGTWLATTRPSSSFATL